ncbi:MAG: hypothetical protein ACE14V_07485 [bacterium]
MNATLTSNSAPQPNRMPIFVQIMAIIDLILCLWSGIAIISILLLFARSSTAEGALFTSLFSPLLLALISGFGRITFGILGNILLLCKKPISIVFCGLNIVAKFIGIIYNLLTAFTILQILAKSIFSFRLIASLIFNTVISPIIFVLYIIAVYKGYTYFNRIKESRKLGDSS